jgi:hypothetical protein
MELADAGGVSFETISHQVTPRTSIVSDGKIRVEIDGG